MPYAVRIKRQAKRKLETLPVQERQRIAGAIAELGADPDDVNLDTRRLAGSDLWRLRVGHWRVIYDRYDEVRIISIERIGPRGDVYK